MTLQKPVHQVVATVLGAGTMGAGIAAHLASAGCKTFLLDIVPRGVGADAGQGARSAIAERALKGLAKAKPPALMSAAAANRIVPGNLEDHLAGAVAQSDLVIEAVVERLDIKVDLFQRVAAASGADTILATNTSGISIDGIAQGLPASARARFLGLHFFNPPRFMHLLEVIPGTSTDPEVVREASAFCDVALGKGIVPCRDTPNFIGNRVGIAEMLLTFRAAAHGGLTVEEVDYLNGPLLGRPRTGSFRLGDLVGIDVIGHVIDNLKVGLSGEPGSSHFDPLYGLMDVPNVIRKLIESGRLGDKTGAGFYKKTTSPGGGKQILSLDLNSLEYRPEKPPAFSELEALLKLPVAQRVRPALESPGKGGQFLRDVLLPLFNYAVHLSGVICDSPAEIDAAMRWGYGWAHGPVELLDAAGPAWVVDQLRERGEEPAAGLVEIVEQQGDQARFYDWTSVPPKVAVRGVGQRPVAQPEGAIFLAQIPPSGVIHENATARLVDLGDGVACFEFRSKANTLDAGVVRLLADAPQILSERGFLAMVLGNQGEHFCRGANLLEIAQLIEKKDFDGLSEAIRVLQDALMGLRHGPIPVVAAPFGQTLGGGTEACLHCAEIQAGADLFLGLVEVGVGVLPAGGGLKEIARRASSWAAQLPSADPYEWVRRGFEAVAKAQVSSSAFEAREMGYLAPSDGVTFHQSRVIAAAKKRALALAIRGWVPPDREEPIAVIGEPGAANLMMGLQMFEWGGFASAYDRHIGKKIVHVLSGGMRPSPGTVTAQKLLDLEREAFASLCGEEKTFARMTHMLKTKKPLRN